VKRIGSQLRRMALGRRQTADRLVDLIGADPSGIEHCLSVNHLGDSRSGCPGCPTTLGVEGRGRYPAVVDEERKASQIPAGSATGRPGEGVLSSRSKPALVPQVVLEQLLAHRLQGRSPDPFAQQSSQIGNHARFIVAKQST
jgi:hypothetical protein